ncbi:hypothetical protein [Fodinibius salsisoli]|uniref:PEP-CTERM protein-sorting domain-containing protein n=1 Tax=Fodinibius salsisoli TaxID=2820877 RepID=A0ABT3PN42_9BACT|nr:hypothetical protein [Fodinibius salsisoli]MCW9707138.1 hypothetical protein [Fodinibius salsisoli]
MKILGIVVSIVGLVGFIYSGINYINNSETFSAFGVDVAVSKGDPVPIVVSVVVLIAGLLITRAAKK